MGYNAEVIHELRELISQYQKTHNPSILDEIIAMLSAYPELYMTDS